MSWVYLITAPDQIIAEMWKQVLDLEKIPTILRAGDTSSFMGVSNYPCRLMVQDDVLDKAKHILETQLGESEQDSA